LIVPNNPINNTLYALDLIAERHKALSCNIANMNTPNYHRKDISFSQYLGGAYDPLQTDLAAKMGPSPISVETSNEKIDPATELSEIQKNSILYTIAARRMSSLITEMKSAINILFIKRLKSLKINVHFFHFFLIINHLIQDFHHLKIKTPNYHHHQLKF